MTIGGAPLVAASKLAEYCEITARIKSLEKRKEKLNKEIKSAFGNKPTVYELGGYVAKAYEQDRSTMDEEATIKLLREKELFDCIQTKEILNETAVEEAIYNGRITQAELDSCVIPNRILALVIKKEGDY